MCHLGHFATLLSWHWLCSTDESFAVEQPLASVCMRLTASFKSSSTTSAVRFDQLGHDGIDGTGWSLVRGRIGASSFFSGGLHRRSFDIPLGRAGYSVGTILDSLFVNSQRFQCGCVGGALCLAGQPHGSFLVSARHKKPSATRAGFFGGLKSGLIGCFVGSPVGNLMWQHDSRVGSAGGLVASFVRSAQSRLVNCVGFHVSDARFIALCISRDR